MKYLLDTNICIVYLNNRNTNVVEKLKTAKREDILLCQIVKAELVYGACKSARQAENLALLKQFFQEFESLSFNDKAVKVYGEIRAELEKMGKPIGPNDLIIASIAIAHNATLVTNNTREFCRISQLKTVDWM